MKTNKLIQRHWLAVVIVLALLVGYFALRLPNLTLQPIFADEAIYIRWAQIMRSEPSLRFLPLSDGKTPLYMWALMPLFKVFEDPLYAGRFLSVLSGAITAVGALFLGWKFFNRNVGLWALLLVVVTPYMLFFDRMALVDSMLAAFSIWSLNFALLLVQYPRLDLAMILGYFLGGGLLTKPPAFFAILSLPFTLLTFSWLDKNRQTKLLKLFGLWIVSIGITMVIYNILRLGQGFVNLNSRNQDYVRSPDTLLVNPFNPLLPHLFEASTYFDKLIGIPVILLFIVGVVAGMFYLNRYVLVLLLWTLFPLVVQLSLLQALTARYLLFSIAPLLCVAAFGIDTLLKKIPRYRPLGAVIIFLLVAGFALKTDWYLINNPTQASLPTNERRGYFEDWTAGYGFPEIAEYLINESKNGKSVVVGTEGSFGTLPDGLQIYLEKYILQVPEKKRITVIGGTATVSAQIRQAALDNDTYFVTNKSRYPKPAANMKLIKEYPKAKGPTLEQDAIVLYQVFPLGSVKK